MKHGLELKVGLLIIFATAISIGFYIFFKSNPFSTSVQHFTTYVANAGGVGERTQVRLSGVRVGNVSKVDIVPDGVVIHFEIDTKVKLPKDSHLEIRSRGVLGDVFLEMVRGKDTKETLHSGDKVIMRGESGGLEPLMAKLGSISDDVKKVTAVLANVIGTKEGETSLKDILGNVQGFTKDLKDFSGSQTENLKILVADLKSSAKGLKNIVANEQNRKNVEVTLANLRTSTDGIKRLIAKIERGEGTVGQLVSKDDTANEIKATLKSVQDVIKPITKLKLKLVERAEYRILNAAKNDSFVNDFNVIISSKPSRYYLLGVTTAAYGRKVTNSSTSTTGSETNTTVNTTEDSGLLRFNAQIAQRYKFIGLRLGLFASSVGIAADAYAFHDALQGSVEISQVNGSPTPSDDRYGKKGPFNLKTYVNIFPIPQVFITAGVDGLVLFKDPFPFVGAGFTFTDEDLNGIFGLAATGASAAN